MGGNSRNQPQTPPAAVAPIWSGGKQIPGAWTDAQRAAGGRWQRPDRIPGETSWGHGENWVKPPPPQAPASPFAGMDRHALANLMTANMAQYGGARRWAEGGPGRGGNYGGGGAYGGGNNIGMGGRGSFF